MALHEGHVGGPAFRWDLQAASPSMKKQSEWDLQAYDLLGAFINTLAEPLAISKQNIKNRKGGNAEVIILKYKEGDYLDSVHGNSRRIYHGTHLAAARSVLREGYFRDSEDAALHEFSLAGVYTTTDAFETLEPYAISVALTSAWSWTTPWVKCVFVLQPRAAFPLRKRHTEEVYRGQDLEILELHLLRGYDFKTAAGKWEVFSQADADSISSLPNEVNFENFGWQHPWDSFPATSITDLSVNPWTPTLPDASVPPPVSVDPWGWEPWGSSPATSMADWSVNSTESKCQGVAARIPPPPPPPQFEEHVCIDPVTNATRSFYFDVINRTSQWEKPEKIIPRAVKEWVVGEKWSWDVSLRCNVCNSVKPISEFYRSSQKYDCSFRKCRAC